MPLLPAGKPPTADRSIPELTFRDISDKTLTPIHPADTTPPPICRFRDIKYK